MRKKVFICSPFRGDVTKNGIKAAGYCRKAYEEGYLPFAPHLFFPQFLNEGSLVERADGIAMGMTFLKECDEVSRRIIRRFCRKRRCCNGKTCTFICIFL